jgi:hypothetical protein
MPDYPLTGHYDSADAISQRNQAFAQITSDLEMYNRSETVSPFIGLYTQNEFEKDTRIIRQAVKEFKEDGEAGDQEAQRGRKAEMTFLAKSYSVRSEFTEEFLEDASQQEILDESGNAFIADQKLLNRLFFIELLRRPTTSTTSNITGFYYGQTDVPDYQGITHYGSAHDHYLTTASASAWASADFESGRNHITHHGYGETNGGIVFMANTDTHTTLSNLSGFTDETITEEQQRNGIVGKLKGVLLQEVNWIPDDYGVFLPSQAVPALVFKQHFKPENVGLKMKPGNNPADPLQGTEYKRIKIGFNTVLKGAGVVMYKGATWTQQTSLAIR